jgi:(R,R)-butanediol dehydrogenase / meso-butanediol dehydrogenase / diacetyl reductase
VAAVRPKGTIVLVGLTDSNVELSPRDLILRDVRLQGSLCYPTTLWSRVLAMIQGGKLPVARLIDAIVPLERIVDEGFERLLDPAGAKLKILVDVAV